MLRILLRNSRGGSHLSLGIAISDPPEKAGNWDAGHLNYAVLADESRGSWNFVSGGFERERKRREEEVPREKSCLHKTRCANR